MTYHDFIANTTSENKSLFEDYKKEFNGYINYMNSTMVPFDSPEEITYMKKLGEYENKLNSLRAKIKDAAKAYGLHDADIDKMFNYLV